MEEKRRIITVELFTDTFRYVGDFIIVGTGHNKRLTDYLNSDLPFIPLLNPKLYTIGGDFIREEEMVIINKTAIKFVVPIEESEDKMEEKAKKYIQNEKYFSEYMNYETGTASNLSSSGTRRIKPSTTVSSKTEEKPTNPLNSSGLFSLKPKEEKPQNTSGSRTTKLNIIQNKDVADVIPPNKENR